MATTPVTKARGLFTSQNPFSSQPDGALDEATNVVINQQGVVESRRGQEHFEDTEEIPNELVFYKGNGVTQSGTSDLEFVGGLGISSTSAPPAPGLMRMKFAESNGNLYYTTLDGVKRITGITQDEALAGVPYGLTTQAVNGVAATVGFQSYDTAVAYRVVFGIRDANENLKLGAPSDRCVLQNLIHAAIGGLVRAATTVTATTTTPHGLSVSESFSWDVAAPPDANFGVGPFTVLSVPTPYTFTYTEAGAAVASTTARDAELARNAIVTFQLPTELTSDNFYRLYRTYESPTAATEPDEEYFLAYETALTSGNISAGYVTVTDVRPEDLLGGSLYTNPNTGDGALAAKYPPPWAEIVTTFDNRMWCFNRKSPQQVSFSLIGTGSPNGLQNNDTVSFTNTVGTFTFTAKTTPGAAPEFKVYTAGSPSQNVEQTSQDLCRVINAYSSNTEVYANYVRNASDAFGTIVLRARAYDTAALTAATSRASAWIGFLANNTSISFTEARLENGYAYSALGEPEAFPPSNYGAVGSQRLDVLAAVVQRDKLFVFLQSGGVWTISGTGGSYYVALLDKTASLIAADTAKPHANAVWCLTDQGVASVTDAGIQIRSLPIEAELLGVLADSAGTFRYKAFGVSYESDRQYQLWLPYGETETQCAFAYVFNSIYSGNGPTIWEMERTCGAVAPDTAAYSDEAGKLWMGTAAGVAVERKAYDRTDYADAAISVSLYSYSGTEVVLDTTDGITVGDLLWQASGTLTATITAINTATDTVTVSASVAWNIEAASVLTAIDCRVKWSPFSPSGPAIKKHFREAVLHLQKLWAYAADMLFDTEVSPAETEEALQRLGYGLGPYGNFPYGDTTRQVNERRVVPLAQQQATQIRIGFSIREAWAEWGLYGYSSTYEDVSERIL